MKGHKPIRDHKKAEQALRDECNRLADYEIKKAISEFDPAKVLEFMDASQVHRKMADVHGERLLMLEKKWPTKFAKVKGPTPATEKRKLFLAGVIATHSPTTYDALAADALKSGASEHWPDPKKGLWDAVWNFARSRRLLG